MKKQNKYYKILEEMFKTFPDASLTARDTGEDKGFNTLKARKYGIQYVFSIPSFRESKSFGYCLTECIENMMQIVLEYPTMETYREDVYSLKRKIYNILLLDQE